jgi:hypothetical protein
MVTKATRDVLNLSLRPIVDGIRVIGDCSANFTIDGTVIGSMAPCNGTFVNLSATGSFSATNSTLPIFPEIQNTPGTMIVTSPATGQVRVPTGVSFLHRGLNQINTSSFSEAERTFNTNASSTYHLRWTPNDGFVLSNLIDISYNPSSTAESNAIFDSNFDNMLISRIVTSAGNVATITNLVNKDRLFLTTRISGTPEAPSVDNSMTFFAQAVYNWSRIPKLRAVNGVVVVSNLFPAGEVFIEGSANIQDSVPSMTRYSANAAVRTDWSSPGTFAGEFGYLDFFLSA